MINVYVNQQSQKITTNLSLQELLEGLQNLTPQFAVAINDKFIPKSFYPTTVLQEDDQISIIVPQQGG